ncbi:MAG: response regulator [Deltaproteobacteria bacterium]|nr:response regulator [Deltaproteobacteria bacterium]
MEWKKKKASDAPSPAGAPVRKRELLLYVEDEDPNWEVAELGLRDRYEMLRARNAREAFALMEKNEFALVLMDIQLSGSDLNGIEITQILKSLFAGEKPTYARDVSRPELPIIFVTAYTARYNKDMLMKMGGADLISKPVNFTNLSLAISRLLMRQTTAKLRSMKGEE